MIRRALLALAIVGLVSMAHATNQEFKAYGTHSDTSGATYTLTFRPASGSSDTYTCHYYVRVSNPTNVVGYVLFEGVNDTPAADVTLLHHSLVVAAGATETVEFIDNAAGVVTVGIKNGGAVSNSTDVQVWGR